MRVITITTAKKAMKSQLLDYRYPMNWPYLACKGNYRLEVTLFGASSVFLKAFTQLFSLAETIPLKIFL